MTKKNCGGADLVGLLIFLSHALLRENIFLSQALYHPSIYCAFAYELCMTLVF